MLTPDQLTRLSLLCSALLPAIQGNANFAKAVLDAWR